MLEVGRAARERVSLQTTNMEKRSMDGSTVTGGFSSRRDLRA